MWLGEYSGSIQVAIGVVSFEPLQIMVHLELVLGISTYDYMKGFSRIGSCTTPKTMSKAGYLDF